MGASKTSSSQSINQVINYKLTPSGNRLYEFTRVSDEDRDKLRIPTHAYLI